MAPWGRSQPYRIGDTVVTTDDYGVRNVGEITDVFVAPITGSRVYVIAGEGYYGWQLAGFASGWVIV